MAREFAAQAGIAMATTSASAAAWNRLIPARCRQRESILERFVFIGSP
jgi:hypothetical protein